MFEEFVQQEIIADVTVRKLLVIVHLIGLAVGAGAAFFSDFFFTNILKNKKIDKTEYRILKLVSSVVWIGLSVLFASGLLIFLSDTQAYLESSKFMAKMTIVFILFLNGLYFHFSQIPALEEFLNKDLSKSKVFMSRYATPFFVGGAISGVSWVSALILGSLSFVDLSYVQIMALYGAGLVSAVAIAFPVKKHLLG